MTVKSFLPKPRRKRGKTIENGSTKNSTARLKDTLAGSYIFWKLYHLICADPSSLMGMVREPALFKLLKEKAGSILDIGSGNGFYFRRLRSIADKIVSLDLNFESHGRLARRFLKNPKYEFVNADAESIPFASGSFDLIFAMEVLEHIVRDDLALREMNRAMKTKGRLVITVPLSSFWHYDEAGYDRYGHKRAGYTKDSLCEILSKNGFKPVHTKYFFFRISQWVYSKSNSFKKLFGFYPPSLLLLPVFLERLFTKHYEKSSLPANVMVIAEKTGDPETT